MSLTIVAGAYALWLFSINLVFYLTGGHNFAAQEYSVLVGIVPMALQALLIGFNPAGLAGPTKVMVSLLLIVLLSYLFNGIGWVAVTYVIELVYITLLTLLVVGSPDRRLLPRLAAWYAVPSAIFLIYIVINGSYLWGRLTAGNLESNAWGLMGLSVVVAAFGHRSRLMMAFCIAAGCAAIYAASSRSSMVGLGLAVLLIAARWVATLPDRRIALALTTAAGAILLMIVAVPDFHGAAMAFLDNLFKLDDPRRGLGMGATGRNVLWEAATDLWWQHPLFGVGFRMHSQYLPLNYSAHNAYLAMLADTGIFGFLWYVLLMLRSFFGMFRIADARVRPFAIAVVASYFMVGFFERRAINGANPMSLFFLMIAVYVLREAAFERVKRFADPAAAAPAVARAGA